MFAGGAIEGEVTSRLSLVATLTETKPVGSAQLLSDGTTAAAQLDVGGGAYVSVTERFTVFASAGRTLSELHADSTKSLVSVRRCDYVEQGSERDTAHQPTAAW